MVIGMKTVLFVCVENACRSQMAEARLQLQGLGSRRLQYHRQGL
ncbi:hypothetical protein KKA03_01040 [archaeon]|nr:hypothetical protein [archaeon]